MILLAGIGGFAAFGMQHRSPLQGDSGRLLPEPPDSLPPDLAAVLTRAGSVTWPVALATLFGLASRGVIRIDEIDGGSVFRKQDFAITPHRSVTSLRPSERALYDLLFSSRKGSRTMLKFSELGGAIALSRSWKTFAGAVKDELREQHIFDEERGRIRRRGTIVGIFVAVSGLVLLIAAVPFVKDYGGASLMIGVATAIVGVVGISIAQSLTPLTDEAIRRASLWREVGHGRRGICAGAASRCGVWRRGRVGQRPREERRDGRPCLDGRVAARGRGQPYGRHHRDVVVKPCRWRTSGSQCGRCVGWCGGRWFERRRIRTPWGLGA